MSLGPDRLIGGGDVIHDIVSVIWGLRLSPVLLLVCSTSLIEHHSLRIQELDFSSAQQS